MHAATSKLAAAFARMISCKQSFWGGQTLRLNLPTLHELGHITGVLMPDYGHGARNDKKAGGKNDKAIDKKCDKTLKQFK